MLVVFVGVRKVGWCSLACELCKAQSGFGGVLYGMAFRLNVALTCSLSIEIIFRIVFLLFLFQRQLENFLVKVIYLSRSCAAFIPFLNPKPSFWSSPLSSAERWCVVHLMMVHTPENKKNNIFLKNGFCILRLFLFWICGVDLFLVVEFARKSCLNALR